MKHIKRLFWTIIGIAPAFLYLEIVMGVNLKIIPWYEIIGFGVMFGFYAAIENKFNKD